MSQKIKNIKTIKILKIIILVLLFEIHSLNLPYLIFRAQSLNQNINQVSADYIYSVSQQTVTTANGTMGNYLDTRTSDNNYFRILNTAAGLDVSLTLNGVRLFNANRLIVMYDGSVSNAGLTYQIQIKDFVGNVWRNIIPHEANYTNTADAAANLIVIPGTTGATAGGYIELYDGYFTDGSNNPVATPLGNFVNKSGQAMFRFYSAATTANWELRIDYLAVQAAYTPMYYVSSMTNNADGSITNEYNDTTHDDATTNLLVNSANPGGIDIEFKFEQVSLPFADANTYLIEFSGLRTTITNYSLYLRDYQNSQWDLLNATALTATTDDTYYFSLIPSVLSQNMSDYIQNGQMKIQITSTSTSGSVTVDYLRLTIGSTATNTGTYVGTITRGDNSSGDITNTRTLDTSQALSGWIIATNNTDSRTSTEFYGDCNTAANDCASAHVSLPITPPDNSIVEGSIVAYRFNTSNAALDLTFSLRNYSGAYQDIMAPPADQSNIATNIMYIQEQSNPMRPQIGEGPLATIPTFTPGRYVEDATNNAVNLRFRTSTSDANDRTVTWDFAFATIKTITPLNKNTHRWTAEGATLTYGTNNASNFKFTKGDDAQPWNTDPDGTNGTDVYLTFNGVTIPTGANKLIVTSKHRFDVSTTYKMYLFDFILNDWRDITPHAGNFTGDTTVANWDYVQIEFFNGYISNGSNSFVDTPLANYVSSNQLRLRIDNDSTTADLDWDFAQIQFVIDPGYHPQALSVTAPATLSANEYNDVFTDDNTSNVQITPSGNQAEAIFTFSNVVTPPEGFNSVLIESGAWKTTAGSYNLSLKNYTTDSWETIASTVTRTADNVDYFVYEIGDWSNYISSNQMQLQYFTSGNNNILNIDFLQMTLGTIPGPGTTVESYYGTTANGSATSLNNLNTYADTNELDGSKYLIATNAHPSSGIPAMAEMGGREVEINFPFHLDPGTSLAGIIYMYRGQTGSTTLTMTPSIQEPGGNFRALTPSFLYTLLAPNAMPGAADTVTLAVASQAFRQGWYVDIIEDLWKSADNRLRFRFYTSTGLVSTTETKLILDTVFFSYRWIPTETSSTPETQLRHGQWWYAGLKQKDTF